MIRLLPTCTLALLALACAKERENVKSAPTASEAATSYTVRGVYKGAEGETIVIHHETIPDFVDRKGKKVGMMSMSMPFGVGDGVSVDALAPGAPVEFTFTVDFENNPATTVTRLTPLPADTELSISGH